MRVRVRVRGRELVEGVAVLDIEDEQDGVRTAIEGERERLEPVTAGGVPHLVTVRLRVRVRVRGRVRVRVRCPTPRAARARHHAALRPRVRVRVRIRVGVRVRG